jgi:hypothetical protein
MQEAKRKQKDTKFLIIKKDILKHVLLPCWKILE